MAEPDEPPTTIDPYSVLSLSKSASPAEIKSTYKKLALRLHPDKVPQAERLNAHTKFQELALAYAILSDPRRRRHYDNTGSTVESLDIEDDDFDWVSFFRTQYADLVTVDKINDLKAEYQGSEEEKRDVLQAYTATKGKMKGLYERVVMSNMLVDEGRFRQIIDGSISQGVAESFPAYANETEKQKERRMKKALKEQEDAEEHAKDLGIHDKVFGSGRMKGTGAEPKGNEAINASEGDLAALIQSRVKGRMDSFLGNLEAKYAGKSNRAQRSKKNEPSEEAFERMAKRKQKITEEMGPPLKDASIRLANKSKKRSAEALEAVALEGNVEERKAPLSKKKKMRLSSTQKKVHAQV